MALVMHYGSGFDRITRDPAVMTGKPCIRGMRVTVGMIVGQVGSGTSMERILAAYPYLEREDIVQALRFGERQRELTHRVRRRKTV